MMLIIDLNGLFYAVIFSEHNGKCLGVVDAPKYISACTGTFLCTYYHNFQNQDDSVLSSNVKLWNQSRNISYIDA